MKILGNKSQSSMLNNNIPDDRQNRRKKPTNALQKLMTRCHFSCVNCSSDTISVVSDISQYHNLLDTPVDRLNTRKRNGPQRNNTTDVVSGNRGRNDTNISLLSSQRRRRYQEADEHLISDFSDDEDEFVDDDPNLNHASSINNDLNHTAPISDDQSNRLSTSFPGIAQQLRNNFNRNTSNRIPVSFNAQHAWLPRISINNSGEMPGNIRSLIHGDRLPLSMNRMNIHVPQENNQRAGILSSPLIHTDMTISERRLFFDDTDTNQQTDSIANPLDILHRFNSNEDSLIRGCNATTAGNDLNIANDNDFADITSDLLSSSSTQSLSSALIDLTENFTVNQPDNYDSSAAQQRQNNLQNDSSSQHSSLERHLPLHLLSLFENSNNDAEVATALNQQSDWVCQQNPVFEEGRTENEVIENIPVSLNTLFNSSLQTRHNRLENINTTLPEGTTSSSVSIDLISGEPVTTNRVGTETNNLTNSLNDQSSSTGSNGSLQRSGLQQNWYIYDPRLGTNGADRLNLRMAWRGVQTEWSMPAMMGPPDYDQLSSRHSDSEPELPPPYMENPQVIDPSVIQSVLNTNEVIPPPYYEINSPDGMVTTESETRLDTIPPLSSSVDVSSIPPPPSYDEAVFNSLFSQFERESLVLGGSPPSDSQNTYHPIQARSNENDVLLSRPTIIPNAIQRTMIGILNEQNSQQQQVLNNDLMIETSDIFDADENDSNNNANGGDTRQNTNNDLNAVENTLGSLFAQSRVIARPRWGQQMMQPGIGSSFGISSRLRNVTGNNY